MDNQGLTAPEQATQDTAEKTSQVHDYYNKKYAVTLFRGPTDTKPFRTAYLTFNDIAQVLRQRKYRDKKQGTAMGGYKLKEGATRCNDGVEYTSLITMDIDSGSDSATIKQCLDGKTAVIHSTHSHNPAVGLHKLRVVLPLSRNINSNEFPYVWDYCNDLVSSVGDTGTKKVSQIAFLPSCPEKLADQAEYYVLDGIPIDVDKALDHQNHQKSSKIVDNSDLFDGIDTFPTSKAMLMVERCPAFNHAVHIGGKGQPGELWYKQIHALAYCVDGHDYIHKISEKHVEYSPTKTESRYAYSLSVKEKGDVGPTTCEKIAEYSSACTACEYQGQVTTPVQLGVDDESRIEHAQTQAKQINKSVEKFHKDALILPSSYYDYGQSGTKIFSCIAKRKDMFYRGGTVNVVTPEGLGVLKPEGFVSRIDSYGTVMKHIMTQSGIVLAPRRCTSDAAKALLASVEARDHLPTIRTVTQHPVLSIDGKVLQKGYHPEQGGIYVLNGETIPDVAVDDAVTALGEILCDFDFVSPGDKSRGIASLLSPAMAMAGLLDGPPPIDYAEADQSQSGKTYRQELVREIYGESVPPVAQKKGGVGSVDESLASRLITGRPFIPYDNFRGNLDSPMLEQLLTWTGKVTARVPHKAEVEIDARGVTVQMSSNGILTTPDLANRASITRIIKRPKGYKFKSYSEGDVKKHIAANQPYYLGCVFSVVQAWITQGKQQIVCDHDRRYWACPMNWIVQKLFGLADLMEGHAAAKGRLGDPGTVWLRQLSLRVKALGKFGEVYTTTELAEIAIEEDIRVPGVQSYSALHSFELARRIGSIMRQTFENNDAVNRTTDSVGLIEELIHIDRIAICRAQILEATHVVSGSNAGKAVTKKAWVYAFAGGSHAQP